MQPCPAGKSFSCAAEPDGRSGALEAIRGAARTGKIGDGKLFLSKVDDAIRIGNGERGNIAP
jgi:nitrogen regulatory protein PII